MTLAMFLGVARPVLRQTQRLVMMGGCRIFLLPLCCCVLAQSCCGCPETERVELLGFAAPEYPGFTESPCPARDFPIFADLSPVLAYPSQSLFCRAIGWWLRGVSSGQNSGRQVWP